MPLKQTPQVPLRMEQYLSFLLLAHLQSCGHVLRLRLHRPLPDLRWGRLTRRLF